MRGDLLGGYRFTEINEIFERSGIAHSAAHDNLFCQGLCRISRRLLGFLELDLLGGFDAAKHIKAAE